MKQLICPHCGKVGFPVVRLPKEVVAILACQECRELSVFFRKTIVPINKKIIESGTHDERKNHLAEIIAQFLEAGSISFDHLNLPEDGAAYEMPDFLQPPQRPKKAAQARGQGASPITDQELDRFVRIDLKCLDNPTYFKKIFG